jgi:thiol-disulfide isomerase/thioredoxin
MIKARKLWLPAAAALALVLAAVACGAAAQPAPAVAGLQLPADFQVQVYRGQEVLGGPEVAFSAIFQQEKPVVLNFWAGLCPPCRAEMPHFQAVSEAYADEIIVLGLDIGPFVQLGSRDDGRALIEELNITYPTGSTMDREVVSSYRVLGMPTTVFLTPDGGTHRTWTGLLTEEKLKELLEELLAASES